MHWVYLSPHPDDVALSLGGLLWQQAQAGEAVQVWTVCAGDPPPGELSPFAQLLHARWGFGPGPTAGQPSGNAQASSERRQEDAASCARLGAAYRPFSLPDCIYRTAQQDGATIFPYDSEEAIFRPVHPAEAPLLQSLRAEWAAALPADARVVCPLALGGHVDHRLTRQAAEGLGLPLRYYADYPYALQAGEDLDNLRRAGWQETVFPLQESALQAWVASVAAHRSQISTFWSDLEAMEAAIRSYSACIGGAALWTPPS